MDTAVPVCLCLATLFYGVNYLMTNWYYLRNQEKDKNSTRINNRNRNTSYTGLYTTLITLVISGLSYFARNWTDSETRQFPIDNVFNCEYTENVQSTCASCPFKNNQNNQNEEFAKVFNTFMTLTSQMPLANPNVQTQSQPTVPTTPVTQPTNVNTYTTYPTYRFEDENIETIETNGDKLD